MRKIYSELCRTINNKNEFEQCERLIILGLDGSKHTQWVLYCAQQSLPIFKWRYVDDHRASDQIERAKLEMGGGGSNHQAATYSNAVYALCIASSVPKISAGWLAYNAYHSHLLGRPDTPAASIAAWPAAYFNVNPIASWEKIFKTCNQYAIQLLEE